MGQLGVRIDKHRVKELKDTALTTPHGAEIVVTASRAATLKARPAIRLGDGTERIYVDSGEDNIAPPVTSKAQPPRTGARTNTVPAVEGGKGGAE